MREIKRYDHPIRNSKCFSYDHYVDVGNGVCWYIGIWEYSVDPRYTKSGSWEQHRISENLAKVENNKVVWVSGELSHYELCELNSRLYNLIHNKF